MSTEQLEEVLNALIPFAQSQLEAKGSFPPFAGGLDVEGEVEFLLPGGAEEADSGDILGILRQGLQSGALEGTYRATGVCLDVTARRDETSEPIDAILVQLESEGESLAAYVPYLRGEDGRYVFGEVFFGAHDPEVFPA
jgi:hypothetical protein